jgi:hypothetical protein
MPRRPHLPFAICQHRVRVGTGHEALQVARVEGLHLRLHYLLRFHQRTLLASPSTGAPAAWWLDAGRRSIAPPALLIVYRTLRHARSLPG